MAEIIRVVLDANVIIGALIRPESAPGRILRAAVAGTDLVAVTSAPLLEELRATLRYPRLKRHLKMTEQDQDAFVIMLEQVTEPVSIQDQPTPGICRDPRDEPYLQTALVGRADYVVSGDGDLLTLGDVDGIPILAPAQLEHRL
jgi:putative PIN family toxin of toxin-antitoxin system